ncbi:hypothetical protein FisN_9Lu169 [Fistulifera solaris]|uniref:Uncharacterized protein n=1 Tax=Fistulifera solaris TaxID=1519565 RepID=A0A1Z5KKN4_FISSO|nr:hypothetical protein FisN_9Lu169 [Fistulifera solaris]|eukprot:GAX26873.1 hypothetical protein FisN_9Lu169 [Fistulifera solaris]
MQVYSKQNHLSCSKSPSETIFDTLQRLTSPLWSLQAENVDDVPCLSDCDAGAAESLLPRDFDVDNDDEISSFLLSLTGSREEPLLTVNKTQKGVLKTSTSILPVTIHSLLKIAPSSHPAPRRVRFASDLTTVKEIPHHCSFTTEQKHSLYRDLETLQAESDVICQEIEFECSLYGDECLETVLEEDAYFRNRRGELVHPAHWSAFTDEIVDSLDVDPTSIPSGFSSVEAYKKYLFKYEHFYDHVLPNRAFVSSGR